MSKHHSSVNYVEPNLSQLANDWKVDNDLPRTPRLEDYCMMLNIEVEVFKRDNAMTSSSDNDGDGNQIYFMSARKLTPSSDFVVSFMGGTKVKCHDKNNRTVPYLTTHYADMTTDDLYDYGTTEMIGIKSVDIEYQSSCVPIITINFTDVRGLSLFQPTELSRQNSYQGVGGINADNIAQSFFQCFFRVPMPKYTITLKGYYGKPVTYEVACDKFTTNFNSQSGDFDINTRFIGYSYSFMTDVSMDALLAAPYCPYIGKDYWEQKKSDGTFVVPRKNAASKDDVDTMPTLVEIRNTVNEATKGSDTDLPGDETLTDESGNDIIAEIDELTNIKNIFETWYTSLNDVCTQRYGKNRVFLFQETTGNKEYYRLLILDNSSNGIPTSLAYEYETFPDSFKKTNSDLYAAIEKYNSNKTRKSLTNISQDFSDYTRIHVFKPMFLDTKGNVVFNGFDTSNTLPRTDIVNNVLLQTSRVNNEKDTNDFSAQVIQRKKYQLSFIYNDGVSQYTDAFAISQDYEYITKRINALQLEANQSYDKRAQKARTKALNAYMLKKMGWYPSVENFTRIMMAHVDTLMEIMYQCAEECKDRKAEDLGVTIGSDGNCCDVNENKGNYVPPFPRVVKDVLGDDGIVKKEDAWLGDVNTGSTSFREIDVVNGLFEAVKELTNQVQASEVAVAESNREVLQENNQMLLKRLVCSEDFFITKNPWGDINEITEDTTYRTFAGKIALRMQHVVLLNTFNSFNNWWSDDIVKICGAADAANFHDLNQITNSNFIQGLQTTLTSDFIKQVITENNSQNPWGKEALCYSNYCLRRYKNYKGSRFQVYPFQDVSFSESSTMISSLNAMRQRKPVYDQYSQSSCSVEAGNMVETEKSTSIDKGAFGFLKILTGTEIDAKVALFDNLTDTDIDGYSEKIVNNIKKYFTNDDDYTSNVWCTDFINGSFTWTIKDSKKDINAVVQHYKSIPSKQGTIDDNILTAICTILALKVDTSKIGNLYEQLSSKYNEYTIFMPKLVALQIGAICKASFQDKKELTVNRDKIGISDNAYTPLVSFILRINGIARLYFANYFTAWYKKWNNNITKLNSALQKGTALNLLTWGKDLCAKTLVMIGNQYFFDEGKSHFKMSSNSNKVGIYLDAFLEKIRELYSSTSSDGSTSQQVNFVQTAKTNDDMRKSLYNYLKQLYDKWIPTASRDEWYLDNFFSDESTAENQGNKFYFIDSYYNKINQKLIINPSRLVEKINALLSYQDVNVMMLGFMADIYSINKCMLMSIQNFADLSKRGSMDEMFKPIPYNDIDWKHLNKRTSFVIIYPYQPSRNLNVANNEFNNDGFMLNDENETPMAIRSKESPEYFIPAFGVTYGSQYQSYFKNVNVNMNSPVATQQSIMAKHTILQDSANGSGGAKAAVGQDLYDIYSTQSYTCDVTMMGCAWVQPLMYFVLLNIPMFRGSYLIMKVKHSIKPGDFTTTFTGCRMANVATSLIEDIFSDDDSSSDSSSSLESQREKRADVDNNCPYKVYPLFNEYDGTYTWPADSSQESFARTVYAAWKKAVPSGVDDKTVRIIVAQNAYESGYGTNAGAKFYNLGGVTKHGSQANANYTYQHYTNLDEYVRDKINSVLYHWPSWTAQTTVASYVTTIHSGAAKYSETNVQTYINGVQGCTARVNRAIDSSSTSTSNNSKGTKDHDVYEGLFQAVQQSCNSTPSISVTLKKEIKTDKGKKYLWISQDNGQTDKLGNVFDVILNGYYEYVQELYWVYNGDNSLTKDPIRISVIPSESVKSSTRRVKLYNTKNPSKNVKISKQEDVNQKFVLAITKKYGSLNTEIPQITSKDVFNTSGVTNCDDLVRASGGDYTSPNNGSKSDIDIQLFGRTIPSAHSNEPFHRQFLPQFMIDVPIKIRTKPNGAITTVKIQFHKKLANNIQQIFDDICKEAPDFYIYSPKDIPAYKIRYTKTHDTLSNHGKGAAIDINPHFNPWNASDRQNDDILHQRKSSNKIVKIFARHGFGWGNSYGDWMHFSFYGGS
jgi:LysM repeat protein